MNSVILLDEIKEYIADMQTGIKKVQRGISASAATIAIDAVNMSKAFVVSVSKGSGGYVAARGTVGSASFKINPTSYEWSQANPPFPAGTNNTHNTATSPLLNGMMDPSSLSGGSTDLTTKQYSAKLISATQLQTDGACEWQVIEFM